MRKLFALLMPANISHRPIRKGVTNKNSLELSITVIARLAALNVLYDCYVTWNK
jgi:hypothetical protein